jgi:hypothetical protein
VANKAKPDQSTRFIETARALGCKEDEEAFRDALRRVARQKPRDQQRPAPKPSVRRGPPKVK